jgi:hypothetical protein
MQRRGFMTFENYDKIWAMSPFKYVANCNDQKIRASLCFYSYNTPRMMKALPYDISGFRG